MAQVFMVTPSEIGDDEKWGINPMNVVLIRPRHKAEAEHAGACDLGPQCGLYAGLQKPALPEDIFECAVVPTGEEVTELIFVNTVGAQSSLLVRESVQKVRELFNDSLRGGW